MSGAALFCTRPASPSPKKYPELGIFWMPPRRLVCRMPELSPAVRTTMARYGITDREMEYLQLVLRPQEPSAHEMAEHMGISVGTMDKHRSGLYLKLGVHSRTELHFKAVELGLVPCICLKLGLPTNAPAL